MLQTIRIQLNALVTFVFPRQGNNEMDDCCNALSFLCIIEHLIEQTFKNFATWRDKTDIWLDVVKDCFKKLNGLNVDSWFSFGEALLSTTAKQPSDVSHETRMNSFLFAFNRVRGLLSDSDVTFVQNLAQALSLHQHHRNLGHRHFSPAIGHKAWCLVH
jgi:hypothetical protein